MRVHRPHPSVAKREPRPVWVVWLVIVTTVIGSARRLGRLHAAVSVRHVSTPRLPPAAHFPSRHSSHYTCKIVPYR